MDEKNAELQISVTPRGGIFAYPAQWNNNTALKCVPHLVQPVLITMHSILEFMLVNGQLVYSFVITLFGFISRIVRFHFQLNIITVKLL